jgi:type II secretory pathway pseudopilin PulG
MKLQIAKSNRSLAFTIAEVMVAMVLVGIMFVSLYAGISSGFATINLARQNLRATQIALEKMETMRMYSWEQINSNGFVPLNFTAPFFPVAGTNVGGTNGGGITFYGTTVITNTGYSNLYDPDLRLVIVTVRWTNGHVAQTRSMETLISQYGMQRYIY